MGHSKSPSPLELGPGNRALAKIVVLLSLWAPLGGMFNTDSWAAQSPSIDFDQAFTESLQLFQAGEFEESLSKLQVIVRVFPTREEPYFVTGTCLSMMGRYEEARKYFEKTISFKGGYGFTSKRSLLKIENTLGNFEKSVPILIEIEAESKGSKENRALAAEDRQSTLDAIMENAAKKIESKSYDDALRLSDAGLTLENASDLHLLRAISLLNLGDAAKAKEAFLTAQKLAPQGDHIKDIDDFLDQIKRGTWAGRKTYWLILTSLWGANSNPTLEGESEVKTPRVTSRNQIQLGNHFKAGNPVSFILDYQLFWEEFWGQAPLRTLTHGAHGTLVVDHRSWSIKILGGFNHQMQENRTLMTIPELDIRSQIAFNRFEVGFEYYVSWKNVVDTSFLYLDGVFEQRHVFIAYNTPRWNLGLYAFDIRDAISDLNIEGGARLPLGHVSRGPGIRLVLTPNSDWEIDAGYTYFIKNYFNTTLPSGTPRDDKETGATLRLSRKIRRELTLTTAVELLWNHSTLGSNEIDDKNTFRFTMLGGVRWEILP